jgi:two-component system KDP operon response regulator KdpE
MDKKYSVLVVDDEKQIRKILSINLKARGFEYLEAENGKQALAIASEKKPDAIILDLGLPDDNGLNVLLKLREWYASPIIILSVKNSEEDIVKALDSGANDYVTKPSNLNELMARLRVALRVNPNKVNVPIFEEGNLKVDFTTRTVMKNNEFVKLSATEYEILWLFINKSGMLLTHQYIIEQIWGKDDKKEPQYLRVYIGQLRKKIEDDPSNPKFLITESGIGYRFIRG